MTEIKELKQQNIPAEQPAYITEIQARALISESLLNLTGTVRLLSGQITNLSGNVSITPTGTTIEALSVGSMPSIQGWTSTLVFSSTDADTVAWAAGNIILTDGTTYSISAGNTGNITAITYIYLDISVSTTVLQTSTTASASVGANKILIAVAQNNAGSEATFQVFGGKGGILLKADNIAANSITANEIAANTITASQISADGIIGRTIKATGSASGQDVWLDSSDGTLRFYYNGTQYSSLCADSNLNLVINSNSTIFFYAGATYMGQMDNNGLTLAGGNTYNITGSTGESFTNVQWITSIRVDDGMLQAKGRALTFVGGICTELSSESDWWNVHQF